MWREFQYEQWYDRGQKPAISTNKEDLEKYEILKREAGVK